jgi:hypothetical protein
MRKILGIVFSVLLLVPAIKLSLDRHYCCGKLADVKVSISGLLATCGMVNEDQSPLGMPVLKGKCCEDHLTILNLDYRYYPETPYYNNLKPARDIPAEEFPHMYSLRNSVTETNSGFIPPGRHFTPGPEQAVICLFRI